MPDFPPVAIGIITFNRPDEIRQTLLSLANYLFYSGPVTVVIADDCTPGRYLRDLEIWWAQHGKGWHLKTLPTSRNGGWGRNANNLIRYAFEIGKVTYLYQQEDDYVLRHPLDLDVGVALMQVVPRVGMLRYRATAGVPMLYQQQETDVQAWLPGYREHLGYTLGRITWLEILPQSPTLWLYSNGPHLKRFDFHGLYGMYPEGLKLGETEESYAHVVKDMLNLHPGAPRIAVLPEWIHMHFDHIGVSFQGGEFDK